MTLGAMWAKRLGAGRDLPGMKIPFLIGRALFGGYFLYSGINHFKNRAALAQYAGSKGVPVPDAAVVASGVLLIAGGASILAGVKPKLGAVAVAGFLAGVSPIMHNFWKAEDPAQRTNDLINFSKNLALLGSTLALMNVTEPWPASAPIAQRTKLEGLRKEVKQRLAA